MAATRRLTWRRALVAALVVQWVVVVCIAARAQLGMVGCSTADPACFGYIGSPAGGHALLRYRLQVLLLLGAAGTLSALAVGSVATWGVSRFWRREAPNE
ncbi:MAG TPA: hypothetical protein VN607_05770 [Gemmatimonadaceae bacterium]|nr:hypothetical protein [Gemmatimonadaceae bacterium]